MLMNNKSIIGFYKFNEKAEYEAGDFVIYDGCIYKCVAANPTSTLTNTVMGHTPVDDRENFKIYPGEMIHTAEEYFSIAEKASQDKLDSKDDKFVSMHALYEILQKLYFGVSTNGVVTDYILRKGDRVDSSGETYDYSINGLGTDTDLNLNESISPLDLLLNSKELNNGIIKVSRSVIRTKDSMGNPDLVPEKEADDITLILRQFTYEFEDKKFDTYTNETINLGRVRRRTQEAVDPVSGDVWIRYVDLDTNLNNEARTEFKCEWKRLTIGGDLGLLKKLDALEKGYEQMYDDYSELLRTEKISFKTIFSLSESGNLVNSKGVTSFQYKLADDFFDYSYIQNNKTGLPIGEVCTVVVSKIKNFIGSGSNKTPVYQNYNVTFDTLEWYYDYVKYGEDLDDETLKKYYYVTDDITLVVYITSPEHLQSSLNRPAYLNIALEFSGSGINAGITNIYLKRNNNE